MTPEQQEWVLSQRQGRHHPWHSPPHRYNEGRQHYHITAACYEHRPYIGFSEARMDAFTAAWLEVLQETTTEVAAWCVLPNHYHALIEAPLIAKVLFELGRLHGRLSREWNQAEGTSGRQNFHRAVERTIRSKAHFMATLNYVHHNPVRHGYVEKWTDWPWSSAKVFLERVGRDEAEAIWKGYPLLDYGEGWDDPAI
jgi:putative transposase